MKRSHRIVGGADSAVPAQGALDTCPAGVKTLLHISGIVRGGRADISFGVRMKGGADREILACHDKQELSCLTILKIARSDRLTQGLPLHNGTWTTTAGRRD